MNTRLWAFVVLLATLTSYGQHTASNPGSKRSVESSYSIKERGANHRVWERIEYELAPNGEQVPKIHSYTELAGGMYYLGARGEWLESKEEIELLPNGAGAVASKGQHKIIFPADILNGKIQLNTPDGKWLKSQVFGISYYDTSNGKSVLIAELKSSAGKIQLPNIVFYPDAFTDVKADVRYTYTRAGFEQDIILREQPPSPEAYGLDPETTKLEVLTEFFDPPTPAIESTQLRTSRVNYFFDENLSFGGMVIGHGRAFSQENTSKRIRVTKQWQKLEGRDFLIEDVGIADMQEEIQQLPTPEGASLNNKESRSTRTASLKRFLPIRPVAKDTKAEMTFAKGPAQVNGFVLDYVALNTTFTNYTFSGDTTYYISGGVNLGGTTKFEGGTVIKFSNNLNTNTYYFDVLNNDGNAVLSCDGIDCETAQYRPAVFTSMSDNTIGETISGSSGFPITLNIPFLGEINMNQHDVKFTNLRFCYAGVAVMDLEFDYNKPVFSDCQFLHCGIAFGGGVGNSVTFRNSLIAGNVGIQNSEPDLYILENVTMANSSYNLDIPNVDPSLGYFPWWGGELCVTNTLFADGQTLNDLQSAIINAGGIVNIESSLDISTSDFQTVGGGNYYLSTNSPYRDTGTVNVDPQLLTKLKRKTTYPPILYSNVTFSTDTTWGPQALRDTDVPDLGYHYDPVDYLVDYCIFTNATLTLTNGVAIGCYFDSGIIIEDGASIYSTGTPLDPNWLILYSSVQEQSVHLGVYYPLIVNPYHYGTIGPVGRFGFTKFAFPAGTGGDMLYHGQVNWTYRDLTVEHCEFWNGTSYLGGNTNSVANFKNNLFARSSITAQNYGSATNVSLTFSNNLMWNSRVLFWPGANSNSWCIYNNSFDTCTLLTRLTLNNGYNAYINSGTNRLSPLSSHNVNLTSFDYEKGPLGGFYQLSTNLVNNGSVTANLAGLYHFATQIGQTKEGNSTVDIGYHYVALDLNDHPVDLDGDGIPDYLEDANGNGVEELNESSWILNAYNGLSPGNGLRVFTPLK